jgi:hypothetical protein
MKTSCLLNGGPYGESEQDTGSGHWNPWCVLRVMIDHYQQAQAEFYLPSNQCWGSGALVGMGTYVLGLQDPDPSIIKQK